MTPLLLLIACIVLPGYCVTRRILPFADPVEGSVHAVGFGLIGVATPAFIVAWLLSRPVDPLLIGITAAALVVASRPWSFERRSPPRAAQMLQVAALVVLALALLPLTDLRFGGAFELGYPCLHELTFYLRQHDGSGWTLFDPDTNSMFTHVVAHASSPVLGLEQTLQKQRTANGAIMVTVMSLSGRSGLELMSLVMYFLVAGGASLAARPFLRSEWARIAVGALTLISLHGLMLHMVNSSVFALAGGTLMLSLLLRSEQTAASSAMAGIYWGFSAGSRLAALAWVIPLMLLLNNAPPRNRFAALIGFAASVLPWMLVPWILKGNPLYYISDPLFMSDHEFLGASFRARGFNWPFTDALVRTAGHVLPPLFLLPIKIVRSAGAPLLAAMLVGAALCCRRSTPLVSRWVVPTWMAPIMLFLFAMVYIDDEKASWLLLAGPAVPLAFAAFLSLVADHATGPRLRRQVIAAWVVAAVAFTWMPRAFSRIELPIDERVYMTSGAQAEPEPISDEDRRRELARISILPSLQTPPPGHGFGSFARALFSGDGALGDHGGQGGSFQSGRTIVWSGLTPEPNLRFPVHTTADPPKSMPIDQVSPWKATQVWERMFAVHLRLDSAPTVEVKFTVNETRFAIDIDPGPLPHTPRHLLVYIDYAIDDDFPTFTITRKGVLIPAVPAGFIVDYPDQTPNFADLRLVTNVRGFTPEEPQSWTSYGPHEVQFSWQFFGSDQTRQGIPPSEWRAFIERYKRKEKQSRRPAPAPIR